jgi:hypothetical protein
MRARHHQRECADHCNTNRTLQAQNSPVGEPAFGFGFGGAASSAVALVKSTERRASGRQSPAIAVVRCEQARGFTRIS